jgi:hypothetical protein
MFVKGCTRCDLSGFREQSLIGFIKESIKEIFGGYSVLALPN